MEKSLFYREFEAFTAKAMWSIWLSIIKLWVRLARLYLQLWLM